MSFVNGVYTSRGGKHVTYCTDQIVNHIQPVLEKRLKRDVKPSTIRQHLCVFCNCLIENPTFDSQTKECLTTTSRVCRLTSFITIIGLWFNSKNIKLFHSQIGAKWSG